MVRFPTCLVLLFASLAVRPPTLVCGTTPPLVNNSKFTYWCEGACTSVSLSGASPLGGIILMGGGTDTDAAFKQLIAWADHGNVLVIRAYGDDAYNPYIRALGKTHSVATLLTKSRLAAEDPELLGIVGAADAIFFAGGDQWTYLQQWEGTALQNLVQDLIDHRHIPVGGTSAGCDIQGGAIYTAANDSVVSSEALRDPYNFRITLQPFPFLNHSRGLLARLIVDTHFITRDRMGRLVSFVARLRHDKGGIPVIGVGIDEQTAIAIDANGKGTLMMQGEEGGRAFVLTPSSGPSKCEPGVPLEFSNITVQKLDAFYGDTFDFIKMRGGSLSQMYDIAAGDGRLSPRNPYTPPEDASLRRPDPHHR